MPGEAMSATRVYPGPPRRDPASRPRTAFAGGGTDVPLSEHRARAQLREARRPRLVGRADRRGLRRARSAARWRRPASSRRPTACPSTPEGRAARDFDHGHWEGKTRAERREGVSGGIRALAGRPLFNFAPPGRRDRPRRQRARDPAGAPRRSSGRTPGVPGPRRVAQGHHPPAGRLAARLRPAPVPRPPRPEPGLPEHPRLQGRLAHARLSLFNDISHYSPTPSGTAAVASGRLSGTWGKE